MNGIKSLIVIYLQAVTGKERYKIQGNFDLASPLIEADVGGTKYIAQLIAKQPNGSLRIR